MDNLLIDNLLPLLTTPGAGFDVLRLDQLHPIVSGNKLFKLKLHLQKAQASPGRTILTFGGAWSNHLVALAFAAKQLALPTVGIIRGERPALLSPTLQDAISYGMQLVFIPRSDYVRKDEPDFLPRLAEQYPDLTKHYADLYIVPEGGGGEAGILGSEDILRGIDATVYTHICCAIGTGTTFMGLVRASTAKQTVIGIPVLKGLDTLEKIDRGNSLTTEQKSRCLLFPDYHFGGYARHPRELLEFMNRLYRETHIPSDIVYTAKLFYALYDLIDRQFFQANARLLVIHSGGLQGNRSLSPGQLDF